MKEKLPKLCQLSALLVGSLALSGCASIGNTKMNDSELQPVSISDGFIINGANIRFDPVRLEDDSDGASNACTNLSTALVFGTLTGYRSVEDSNGSWIGLNFTDMPQLVETDCSSDGDGIVWVNQKLINATVTPLPLEAVSTN